MDPLSILVGTLLDLADVESNENHGDCVEGDTECLVKKHFHKLSLIFSEFLSIAWILAMLLELSLLALRAASTLERRFLRWLKTF
uniref:AlNc14C870G12591 protein n=1 Tax=Albugo laibachii Nc14 TaxID=890382 RepID=F0X274_9STRA|nr:AlNc14C870G12591 [Albugo laibachii Nc14]|eukprot:CCA27950.1 AlNc14C870G12591 [Albugo laibachii Nc14]